jgi:hypothetical protein
VNIQVVSVRLVCLMISYACCENRNEGHRTRQHNVAACRVREFCLAIGCFACLIKMQDACAEENSRAILSIG